MTRRRSSGAVLRFRVEGSEVVREGVGRVSKPALEAHDLERPTFDALRALAEADGLRPLVGMAEAATYLHFAHPDSARRYLLRIGARLIRRGTSLFIDRYRLAEIAHFGPPDVARRARAVRSRG